AQAEARGDTGPLVWAAGDNWHPGVIGIVAARLKETFGRPALVFGFEGASGKGSGRSVPGVDLGASVQRLVRDGLIEKGGGHRMAAGLSLTRDQLEPAMARLSELLARQGRGQEGAATLRISGLLMPEAARVSLVETLEQAGPYGAAAPAPRFAFPDCRILDVRQIGQGHLKLRFGDGHSKPKDAIAFGAWETELGIGLAKHAGALFHLAGRLELNSWGGRTMVQLRLEDAAPAGGQ
ncbi:MAG: DHHA1 domain-containing protein, partial [Pseudomonadota bacterium]